MADKLGKSSLESKGDELVIDIEHTNDFIPSSMDIIHSIHSSGKMKSMGEPLSETEINLSKEGTNSQPTFAKFINLSPKAFDEGGGQKGFNHNNDSQKNKYFGQTKTTAPKEPRNAAERMIQREIHSPEFGSPSRMERGTVSERTKKVVEGKSKREYEDADIDSPPPSIFSQKPKSEEQHKESTRRKNISYQGGPSYYNHQTQFKPSLDPVSVELVRRTRAQQQYSGKKKWEQLYELDKIKKEKRDRLYIEKKILEQESSVVECTFHPDTTMSRKFDSYDAGATVYQRGILWQQIHNEKMLKHREKKNEEIMKECSFSPNTIAKTNSQLIEIINTNGVNKFLERQFVAQKWKDDKMVKLNKFDGSNWKAQTTVPVGFGFDGKNYNKKELLWDEDKINLSATHNIGINADTQRFEETTDFDQAVKELHKELLSIKIQII